ncbi:DUF1840 domain-containing protein [Acidovorax lacteus]|uniref:DUF1840 domain-containing protein n=1 Tax=Acidovorax lacteus TaxID=1924988 RepID=A0ABP8LAQ0_9BURK
MLYKFKSRAVADLIMLEPQGRQILEIIGKTPGATGIVTVAQIPEAIAALESAVAAEEARRAQQAADAAQEDADEVETEPVDAVHLRQRVVPFIDLLRRSAAEGYDVVWGV